MTEKNEEFSFQSAGSKPGLFRNDSIENIISIGSRKSSCNAQRIFISIMDTINHALIILVTVYIIYHAAKEYSITSIHVILCTIGYVLLMSEAIVVLASDNILTTFLSRRANKYLHCILQAVGLILNLVGVSLMYNIQPIHFRSIHGITGFTSLMITIVATIFGYPVWIAWKLRKFVRPIVTKLFHNFLGISGFVIGMISQCYGYKKNWIYQVSNIKHVDEILLVLTVLIIILSLRGALSSFYRQATDCMKLLRPSI